MQFGKENIALYRDDGLALIKGKNGRLADKARKDLCMLNFLNSVCEP